MQTINQWLIFYCNGGCRSNVSGNWKRDQSRGRTNAAFSIISSAAVDPLLLRWRAAWYCGSDTAAWMYSGQTGVLGCMNIMLHQPVMSPDALTSNSKAVLWTRIERKKLSAATHNTRGPNFCAISDAIFTWASLISSASWWKQAVLPRGFWLVVHANMT